MTRLQFATYVITPRAFDFSETQEHKVINDLEYIVTILRSSEPNIESAIA